MFSLEEDWNNLPNINQAATSSAGAVQEEAGGPFGQGVNHGRQEEGEACKPRPGKSVSELWAGREPACLPESLLQILRYSFTGDDPRQEIA